ncbi:MAG: SUMF1/EgtB/PvdO family nonheme iron enzyme [Polyangiaceae bacterium]|nr:SUMF1/EgtB/PvdO family nonheme iron enzyme [Polyangiaceae bacterium]
MVDSPTTGEDRTWRWKTLLFVAAIASACGGSSGNERGPRTAEGGDGGEPASGGGPLAGGVGEAGNASTPSGGVPSVETLGGAGGLANGGSAEAGAAAASGNGCTPGGVDGCPVNDETPEEGPEGPSCEALDRICNEESCCTTLLARGCAFPMGRSASGCDEASGNVDEQPEHSVSVDPFLLDKYEVTVGRFRTFVESQPADGGDYAPGNEGDGAHPGLAGTGWQKAWDESLPATKVAWDDRLTCSSTNETWTSDAGPNEAKALNCVNWYEAMAFCVWDGGYLATEAEWEYAAAGGDENRLYPWGAAAPANDCILANWYGCGQGQPGVRPVGSSPAGAGRWGHQDLAGNLAEWVFDYYGSDWYSAILESGEAVCNVSAPRSSGRTLRGGHFVGSAANLRVADRSTYAPASRYGNVGFRCGRSTP